MKPSKPCVVVESPFWKPLFGLEAERQRTHWDDNAKNNGNFALPSLLVCGPRFLVCLAANNCICKMGFKATSELGFSQVCNGKHGNQLSSQISIQTSIGDLFTFLFEFPTNSSAKERLPFSHGNPLEVWVNHAKGASQPAQQGPSRLRLAQVLFSSAQFRSPAWFVAV